MQPAVGTYWSHLLPTGKHANALPRSIAKKKEKTINPLWIGKMFPNNAKWIDSLPKSKIYFVSISWINWLAYPYTRTHLLDTHRRWPRRIRCLAKQWAAREIVQHSTDERAAKRKCKTCKLKRTIPLCAIDQHGSTGTGRHWSGAQRRRKKQQDISRSKMMQFIVFVFFFTSSFFFSLRGRLLLFPLF